MISLKRKGFKMSAATIEYGEMIDLEDSLHEMEIERLIEDGVISSSDEFDPERDYRMEDLDGVFDYMGHASDFDGYNEEAYY